MRNVVTPEAIIEFLGELGLMESVSGSTTMRSFTNLSTPEAATVGSLCYLDRGAVPSGFKGSMLICDSDSLQSSGGFIRVSCRQPRLAMARVISHFFNDRHDVGFSKFGDGCFEKRTRYADMETVMIGACVTIGSEGMGFMRDKDGHLMKFPSVGGVTIHEDVEIADHATIVRGEVGDTIIGAGSKIGHHSYIGPEAVIERDVLVEPHVIIGARTVVGHSSTISAGSKIRSDWTIEPRTLTFGPQQ